MTDGTTGLLADRDLLREIVACPTCRTALPVDDRLRSAECSGCGARYRKDGPVWDFVPPTVCDSSPLWRTWQLLQHNGEVSYREDPEHNLAVGEREDCRSFSAFCAFRGLVLDVGCGPQPWPAYFDREREATYVGIDPLVGEAPPEFLKLRALGELPPFRDGVFDHVLFGTTLDHFVDPLVALRAAARVMKPGGQIDVWLGEKRPDAPPPATSPAWYRALVRPALADDVFHLKRLDPAALGDLVRAAGLSIVETRSHLVDPYRTNHFHRLTARAPGGKGRPCASC